MLTPYVLRYAYAQGVFPMTLDNGSIGWFQPQQRALFPLSGIHISRSLAKKIRRGTFEVRFDTAYENVIRGCFRPDDNWLSEEFVVAYCQAHAEGWGHCAECWQEGELVGGVYGLALGTYFAAESMFHRKTDASKVALWALVERCREAGFTIFDAQIMNPHLESLGAYEVPHRRFMKMLKEALAGENTWVRESGR